MNITKAVIPVAGLGTRFLPVSKSVPKEMLPIIDKPCIQYIVEEAVNSGIKEIIFVISPEKLAVRNYFSPAPKLEKRLQATGKTAELKTIKQLEKLAIFHYVYQKKALGDGDAILHAAKFIKKNESFAVLFGDDIYDSPTPALKQLITQYNKVKAPIIALEKISRKDSYKYGIIKVKKQKGSLYEISNLVEKPSPATAPSNLAIAGKYIVTPELFATLKKSNPFHDSELRLIDGMLNHIKHSPIFGHQVRGLRFDTGDKHGYLKAITHFAKKQKI